MTFDAKSILERLRADIPSEFSTMEGTFAGDILGACAQELARIHDQEMESMAERAFVSTACGEWLDLACADYGINRKISIGDNGEEIAESDEELRRRGLFKVQNQASSGNAAHYRIWATQVEGVQGAMVEPLNRGQGTVDVFIIASEAGLCPRVKAYIEERRPVGVSVEVFEALPVEIGVSGAIRVAAGGSSAEVESRFSSDFRQVLQELIMSGDGQLVSVAEVYALLLKCGATDVSQVKLNGVAESYMPPKGRYAVLGSCSFVEERG